MLSLIHISTEKMHEYVRKEAWGYAKEENLGIADLLVEKYQGIRPAVDVYKRQGVYRENTEIWFYRLDRFQYHFTEFICTKMTMQFGSIRTVSYTHLDVYKRQGVQ